MGQIYICVWLMGGNGNLASEQIKCMDNSIKFTVYVQQGGHIICVLVIHGTY